MSIDKEIEQFEKSPVNTATKWLIILMVVGSVITIAGYGLGWFTNAAKVAHQEFNPEAMLRKYEWFKDAAASLDKKQANIVAYRHRMNAFLDDYKGVPKREWPRDDRQSFNQLNAEYQGMLQMYNSVAAEYNAQSNKFNWSAFDVTKNDAITKQFKIME